MALFFYSPLIHYILTVVSPPSTPSTPTPPSLPDLLLLHCPLKKAGVPEISTEYGIANYNKTRHKPSYQGWAGQPSRRKRVCMLKHSSLLPPGVICLLPFPLPHWLFACQCLKCSLIIQLSIWWRIGDIRLIISIILESFANTEVESLWMGLGNARL